MPALTGIDHVIIAVGDLERARHNWERLGFTVTPRGRHLQQGTGNYCIMFAADYIELLGVVDPALGAGGLTRYLEGGEGLCGVSFGAHPDTDVNAELARRGLHPDGPRDLARQLELPEGTELARFLLTGLPPDETPGLHAFICRHLTPALVRRPSWLVHANGVTGIASIFVVVDATEPLLEPYERLFGAAVNTTDDVLTIHVGPQRLIFATLDDFSALHPEVELAPDRALPAIAALSLRSNDLARCADHLAQWQVGYEELADGSLLVPPQEANGTLLYFVR